MSNEIIEITPSFFMKSPTWRYGQKVKIKCRIVGFGRRPKNIPRYLIIHDDNNKEEIDLNNPANYMILRNYLFDRNKLIKSLKEIYREKWGSNPIIEGSNERLTLIDLAIRDIYPEKSGEHFIYHDFHVILIGESIPPFKTAYLDGYIIDDNKDRITAIIYSVQPLREDFETLTLTPEDIENFNKYFRNNPNLVEDIDRTIKPKIVGRPFEKFMIALTLHSPLEINFLGEKIRGVLHTIMIGDSTTGKSKIINWICEELKLGEYGVGESGKRSGLLFTVNPEADMIIWGLLVQADRTLALIDGLQKLSTDEISEFREALRNKKIVVRMKKSGEAPARCRIIAAANPNLPLDEYIDLAEAITDVKTFRDPVDITRWDIFLRFYQKDVPDEEIAKSVDEKPRIPIEVFRKHVLWAWSLKPEDIIFTNEAIEKIRELFIKLLEYSTPKIPIINKGSMETLARISASYAILIHNVENNKVIVTSEIIDKIGELFQTMLDLWEYSDYVARIESLIELSDEEYNKIINEFTTDLTLKQVFEAIANEPGIRTMVIAEKVGISKTEVIRNTARLKSMGLIESRERKPGYRLSKKGVTVYRRMTKEEKEESEITSENIEEKSFLDEFDVTTGDQI